YVVDSQGCDDETDISVDAPAALEASATPTDITCNGFGNGQISTTAIGGTPVYTYNIGLGGTTSGLFVSLGPDEYTIIVTDINDCADTVTVSINEPEVVAATAETTNALCFGSNDGTVTVDASGGVGDYTYELDNTGEQTSNVFEGLDADEYTITVMDENGCTGEVDVEVTEPSQLVVTVTGSTDETGVNANDGSISVNVSGGTPGYTFEWTDPDGNVVSTDEDPTDLPPGDYTLLVTDANGCERSLAQFVNIEEYVGISELSNGLSVKVSPNPTMGEFVLNMSGLNGEKVNYMITDTQGRLVQEMELGNRRGENVHRVDLSPQAAGIYYLHLFIGSQQTTIKVVKQ
ncbi:MAG: T9SS type A sorting domain-containing protein, partial [Flavobacteriales bacterium]|nr:T9SS type A sorting domain-containing protein [Flavobacteriales bacterium]